MQRPEFERLKSEMEELFADLCQVPRLVGHQHGFRPAVDVYRTGDPPTVTVVLELAGVQPSDLEIAVADGVLAVAGTRRRDGGGERAYEHVEIEYGRFERRVRLPEPVDADAAEATFEQGMLTIVLPLARRAAGPVRVTISRGAGG